MKNLLKNRLKLLNFNNNLKDFDFNYHNFVSFRRITF